MQSIEKLRDKFSLNPEILPKVGHNQTILNNEIDVTTCQFPLSKILKKACPTLMIQSLVRSMTHLHQLISKCNSLLMNLRIKLRD